MLNRISNAIDNHRKGYRWRFILREFVSEPMTLLELDCLIIVLLAISYLFISNTVETEQRQEQTIAMYKQRETVFKARLYRRELELVSCLNGTIKENGVWVTRAIVNAAGECK